MIIAIDLQGWRRIADVTIAFGCAMLGAGGGRCDVIYGGGVTVQIDINSLRGRDGIT
jgi:hypothetical protein